MDLTAGKLWFNGFNCKSAGTFEWAASKLVQLSKLQVSWIVELAGAGSIALLATSFN